MLFSEIVTTPHPRHIEADTAAHPLAHSEALEEIQTDYEDSHKTHEETLEAAHRVAALVRDTFTFASHTADQPELTPQNLNDNHATNCHGHSIVTSECLDMLDIKHRIGFSNLHSFIMLEDDELKRVDMIDTADSKLCLEISPALGNVALNELDESQGSSNFLQGNRILQNSRLGDEEKNLLISTRPWLSFASGKPGIEFWSKEDADKIGRLILRTYPSKLGRETLLSFTNFTHSTLRQNPLKARPWLMNLDGTYPDIDRRNKLRAATRHIRRLGILAAVDEALEDISIIKNSLTPFTNDLILRLWAPDERRNIGVKAKSADIVRQTLDEYGELLEEREATGGSTTDIENRIQAAENQLARLVS